MRSLVFIMALAALMVPIGPRAAAPSDLASDKLEAEGDLAAAAEIDAVPVVDPLASEADERPTFSPRGEVLVRRMAEGFLGQIRRESPKWWGCGVATPLDEQPERADRIARGVLAAMREHDLRWLSPWAVVSTIWSESRGDPCAIGPNSRKAARDLGLVPEDRAFNRWTAEDVRALLEHPRWKRSRDRIGADIGMGQEVWQRYARILDPEGDLRCGKRDLACRVPTLDEVMRYDSGAKVVITGMVHRRWMYRNTQPWEHWPGSIRNLSYSMKIARLAQSMGGSVSERPVW